MDKLQLLQRLCKLVTDVAEAEFCYVLEHDCFCGDNPISQEAPVVNEKIIAFIEKAVHDALPK